MVKGTKKSTAAVSKKGKNPRPKRGQRVPVEDTATDADVAAEPKSPTPPPATPPPPDEDVAEQFEDADDVVVEEPVPGPSTGTKPKRKQSLPVRLSDEHEDYMVEFLKSHEAVWSKAREFQDIKQADKVKILEEAAEHVGRTGQ